MLLELRHINKDFPRGKEEPAHILRDISLDVEEGEYIAIMGPSGSGKSTLMNIIGCLDTPTSGTYFLNGKDISTATDDELAEIRNFQIGFVFQSFYLLPKLNAMENVELPLLYAGVGKKERRERAIEALQNVGLGEKLDRHSTELSGGQCQRVAIARAMICNPKILLADEPTGALDSATGRQVMGIFDELNRKGTTVVLITHAQEVADYADKVHRILDGKIYLGESKKKGG